MRSLVNVFDEITNNPMTVVGAKYTKEDVLNVWTQLSKQIVEALKGGKGISIKGLGTFTLSNWSLETGNNGRAYEIWKPVFLISKSLTEDFDLHQPKQYANDAIPLTQISYLQIANICGLSKEAVIGCIEEATQCFRKTVSSGKQVHFPMAPLGNLSVIETNVKFTFNDACQRRPRETPEHCAKFPTANAPYTKKYDVPCAGHAKSTC